MRSTVSGSHLCLSGGVREDCLDPLEAIIQKSRTTFVQTSFGEIWWFLSQLDLADSDHSTGLAFPPLTQYLACIPTSQLQLDTAHYLAHIATSHTVPFPPLTQYLAGIPTSHTVPGLHSHLTVAAAHSTLSSSHCQLSHSTRLAFPPHSGWSVCGGDPPPHAAQYLAVSETGITRDTDVSARSCSTH
ncbi:hypothetical protein B0H10DRAFT_1954071 [Mycena sp. CBHHK59/15]|nr:hypothetical protein B0H10DRAFT_1954071 [Mycena sp. CBHHK59/15]